MLLPLLLTLSAPDALAQDGGLAAAWGANAPPSSWVVVLESASAEKKTAEAAREPIAKLVEALPAGDRVEIIAVHARSSPVLPARTVSDADRAALAAEIRALEIPSAKSNDLGAGLTAIATSLDAAPAGSPRHVLFVGTFCHSPPLGSVWADGGYGCRAIRSFEKLQQAYDAGTDRDLVSAHLFPVTATDQPANDGGVDETRKLFEPAGAVEVAKEPFAAWIEALLRGRLADERVRPLARAEAARLALTATVGKEPSMEAPRAELRLATGLSHLAFAADTVNVTGATAVDAASLHLAPDGVLTVDVDVPKPPFSLLPRTDAVEVPVTVRLGGKLVPTDALAAVGVSPERTGVTTQVTLKAERHYGLPAWRSATFFAGALLLAGAGGLVVRRRVQPVHLGGTFTWRRAGGPRHTLHIEHLTEAAVVVQPDGTLGLGRREDAVFVLRVERPLWNARTTVEIRVPNVEINTKPVAPGRHPVVAGATSLQFRDYRLSWE